MCIGCSNCWALDAGRTLFSRPVKYDVNKYEKRVFLTKSVGRQGAFGEGASDASDAPTRLRCSLSKRPVVRGASGAYDLTRPVFWKWQLEINAQDLKSWHVAVIWASDARF